MENLPKEIIYIILQYADFHSLIAFAGTNRLYRNLTIKSKLTEKYIIEIGAGLRYPEKFAAANYAGDYLISIYVTDKTLLFRDFPRTDYDPVIHSPATIPDSSEDQEYYTKFTCVRCGDTSGDIPNLLCIRCTESFDPENIEIDPICRNCNIIIYTNDNEEFNLCTFCHAGDCWNPKHYFDECAICCNYYCVKDGKLRLDIFGNVRICSDECAITAKTCNMCKKYNINYLTDLNDRCGRCFECAAKLPQRGKLYVL